MKETQSPPEKKEGQTPDQAVVAFIDILGYGKVVNRLITNLGAIKDLERLLKSISAGLIEDIMKKLSLSPPYDDYSKKLFRAINAKYVSDTILVTLHLSKMDLTFPDFKKEENLSHYIFSYLYFIAMACTIFIGKTGFVLRGGISMGPHYENSQKGSLFILSQAYLNAYNLEQKADTPRILIDDPVYDLVKDLPLEQLPNFTFVDATAKRCLDIYAIFENEQRSPAMLSEIKGRVMRNIADSRINKDALGKLIEFAKYHNQRVQNLGFGDLAINLLPVEKHFQRL